MDKFEWQRAIASDNGPSSPTTRLVLFALSVFMDQNCGNCFPSTKKLSDATGLSERCVCEHLAKAEKNGWIEKIEKTGNGQAWKKHSYEALIPKKALIESKHLSTKGTDAKSAHCQKGTDSHSKGTDSDDIKALTEGQSTITYTKSYTTHNAKTFLLKDGSSFHIDDDFIQLLKTTYPLVDVEGEIKKLSAWCFSNDSKRKTRKGAKRFVNSWMANTKPSKSETDTAINAPATFDFSRQFHEE